MKARMRRVAEAALGLLYPRRAVCMGCDSRAGFPRDWVCEDCRTQLAARWVGATQPPEGGLFRGAACAYHYGGPAGGMVRNLKYRGVWRLAEPMGRHMARAFEAIQPTGADCLVPVPMHRKRLRERGFNHAEALAREASKHLELPVLAALERVRNTRQQARLPDAERLTNMDGAFALKTEVAGRRVVLVDDVCTTGATANACAAALLKGGAEAVYLLCFATARGGDEE